MVVKITPNDKGNPNDMTSGRPTTTTANPVAPPPRRFRSAFATRFSTRLAQARVPQKVSWIVTGRRSPPGGITNCWSGAKQPA